MEKQDVVDLLRKHVCNIKFIKADGSERLMVGTLLDAGIGRESAGKRKETPDVVTVWDMEKDDWRAFRMDRLLGIEVNTIFEFEN